MYVGCHSKIFPENGENAFDKFLLKAAKLI